MNEKPILFSTEMVKAILDGRKTQTRRVIHHAGGDCLGYITDRDAYWFELDLRTAANGPETSIEAKCPYGRPGDLLWVRETWKSEAFYDNKKPSDIPYCANLLWVADEEIRINNVGRPFGKIRQSIFMPRWASRITIRVLNVRVERVQDITIDDARKEGCSYVTYGGYDFDIFGENGDYARHPYIMNFRRLWNSINLDPKPIYSNKEIVAYESYPWSVEDFDGRYLDTREGGMYKGLPITVFGNPWVWVIDFEEVDA